MGMLVLGLLLFIGVHSVRIVSDDWRSAAIARMGLLPWKAVYALASIAGFVLIVWGYGLARQQPVVLWTPPAAMKHATALLMVPVFMLFVAAYVPRNWFKAKLKHPQVLSVKLWAVAHLLSNGTLADVLLFGGLLAWAVLSFRAARQRDRAAGVAAAPAAATVAGTAVCVVLGLVILAAFVMGLHTWLIGVRPV
jgi:uncharacterized membrane protein